VTTYTRRLIVLQRLTDQYAFRQSGSTTAALVALLSSVTQALENNPYVVVVALDFSKAFDTMRHSSAMAKVAQLQLPDCVYNWLAKFLDGHSHCTRFNGHTSDLLDVNVSFVQGSDAAPSWWGFTTSVDRQHIDAVLRRAVQSDLWTLSRKSDAHTFEDLCNSTDDELFSKIKTSSNHTLHALLSATSIAPQNCGLKRPAQLQ